MGKKAKCPMRSSPGILFWRRPIDSRVPTRTPATLAGLTVHLAVPHRSILLRQAAFRRAVLEQASPEKQNARWNQPPGI